jgi:hypothetical protein
VSACDGALGRQTCLSHADPSRPGFEQFFLEAGAPLDEPPAGPPDPAHMQRLLEKYDLELLAPFGH